MEQISVEEESKEHASLQGDQAQPGAAVKQPTQPEQPCPPKAVPLSDLGQKHPQVSLRCALGLLGEPCTSGLQPKAAHPSKAAVNQVPKPLARRLFHL